MPPLAIRNHTATTAVGRGRAVHLDALLARRSGLRRNDLGPARTDGSLLATWIGRVEGLEEAALPEALADWECRNNRLAWLALQQDGLLDDAVALGERHGAERVAVVIGTSTSSIGATEEAYSRLEDAPDGGKRFPADLRRPIVHTPHSPRPVRPAPRCSHRPRG
jgi:3-oxoacyl-[acyl-carrier-protein] synthase-1